ncbi:YutD family protein [Virgibacillus sp. C22-A2]|uniref:YutD family protein n=1 Tax=Virgibacillus tibetensis TaxID=3042313 RepID=A0ABU6KIL9_9BACI|nr:YutD family protein [Virgibacillus sp. C22-A2]
MIELQGNTYEITENIKEGFQEESIKERYSDILSKYDYILGDWGYEQLRLKGFYNDQNPKAAVDTKISSLDDYLYEYCNFGCSYFVLKKVNKKD